MKKMLLVLSLAMVLVFAVATVAGAAYAGFEKKADAYPHALLSSPSTGYLPWAEAQAQMTANGVVGAQSAHGGYTTTTTKCFACHSAHRATYTAPAPYSNNTRQNASLGGSTTCDLCHNSSSTVSVRMIEWTDATTTHTYNGASCTQCHRGSIHGRDTSVYGAMNIYMLGGDQDANIAKMAGDYIPYDANGLPMFDFVTTQGIMGGWFKNGTTAPTANNNLPMVSGSYTAFNWGPGAVGELSSPSAGTFAAAKSLATAVTCNRSGCHTESAFGVFGFGKLDPTSSVTTLTGHTIPIYRPNYTSDASCGPCHPGAPLAGYRNTAVAGTGVPATRADAGSWAGTAGIDSAGVAVQTGSTAITAEEFRRARGYGCEQCHDAIGATTKTTAFPHATDGISVFEWASNGDRSTVAVNGANLWMYAGDINWTASSATLPNEHLTANGTAAAITAVPTAGYSQAFKFIADAQGSGSAFGKVSDGACLKCHVEAKALPNKPFIAGSRHNTVSWTPTGPAATAPYYAATTGAIQTVPAADWTGGSTGVYNVGSSVISLQW